MRNPAEMARDRLKALGQVEPPKDESLPPPPPNVSPNTWQSLMNNRPITEEGRPWNPNAWARDIQTLRADPSPKRIEQFNRVYGPAGHDAQEIINRLKQTPEADKKDNALKAMEGITY
jgi:hypothetical protein